VHVLELMVMAIDGGFFPSIGFMWLMFVLFIGFYVYQALCLQAIARKLKHPRPWLAWIPIVNTVLLLEMGGFHWAFIFLFLVPFLGWLVLGVLGIIALWRICERLHYPGWIALFSLLGGLALLIILSILAWSDN